ncbi:MAG: Transcriptional regulator, AraC family, partial [Solirubrobacterales bacterium]|nr:Transcriptional regulator, AraC family [Solirubrobacterales bacterium]
MAPREIVIVVFDGVQSLDLTGPHEVFSGAHAAMEHAGATGRGYRLTVASRDGQPLRSSSGLGLVPDVALADAPTRIDTLILAGGSGSRAAARDRELVDWVRERGARARRVAS